MRVVFGAKSERGADGARIETPFDADFVEAIKRVVPSAHRTWNDESKAWWVTAGYEEIAARLVIEHYGETLILLRDGSEEYRDRSGTVAKQERLL